MSSPRGEAKGSPLLSLVGVVLFGGVALVALHDWLGVGGSGIDQLVNGPLFDAVVVAAAAALLIRARRPGAERRAWLVFAAALACWAAAEIYWTIFIGSDPSPPVPSPADALYLAVYPLATGALYLLLRTRARGLDWRLWMDGLIVALGTAALGAAVIFELVADRTSGSTAHVVTTLAYPLCDVLMLGMVVGVVALTRWRPEGTWSLLLLGLAALVFADVAYTLAAAGGTAPGTWIEPFFLLAAALIGAEAWQPQVAEIRPSARFDGWRELIVPGIFAAVMIGLFSLQYFSRASAVTAALWAATMLAVLARLALTVRENKRLVEQVRTDTLTGLGNQGCLQADLEFHCRDSTAEPVALLLFDLNGFKHYNDTFGHLAGDAMLRQLGRQLRVAVGADGAAYRLGGDEFAVLARCPADAQPALAARAAAALAAQGPDFDLGAAWGLAAIPAEAATPAEALHLADVRMYAQKDSRRAALDGLFRIEGPGAGRPSSLPGGRETL